MRCGLLSLPALKHLNAGCYQDTLAPTVFFLSRDGSQFDGMLRDSDNLNFLGQIQAEKILFVG
jgi:hypothetical protein